MSKIKKVDEVTDLSVYTSFTKDEGMFQIIAGVYSMVTEIPGATNQVGSRYYRSRVDFCYRQ